jgi:hypothetical protein
MSVKIEIYGEDGADAARQMKQLGDTLALNALSQTIAAQQTRHLSKTMVDALSPVPKSSADMTASEVIAAADQKAVEPAKSPEPAPAEQATAEAEPVDPPKKRRGRKSNAEKAAEAKDAGVVETATDENPNPYRLFDENGAEEELFDTPAAFMTALASMFGDAPDSMTLKAVGKANEETVRRLQEESVDFSDLIKFFEKKKAEIETREATLATSQEPEKSAEADEPAKPEDAPAEEAASTEPVKVPSIDDVRAAIQSLASAKDVPYTIAYMKKRGAAKATDVKEEDRAMFIKAVAAEVAAIEAAKAAVK